MSSRRRPRSPPPVPPLEDDNLLSEILLRPPPDPSSLPRASLVAKRWLGLVSDPSFSRRFRLHHRRNPPLLGFFEGSHFEPTMDPPNRVPEGHFSYEHTDDDGYGCFRPLGWRHGLQLIFHESESEKLVLVRDPFNGDKHRLPVPPGLDGEETPTSGAVFRAAGDIQHFHVVLVDTETNQHHTRAIARVYSSETGIWGNLMATPLPPMPSSSMDEHPTMIGIWFTIGVLVGHSIYWLLTDTSAETSMLDGILEFDLETQILAVIPVPTDIANNCISRFQVMRAEGGGLGILFLSNFSAQLWKMETDSNGVASWVLGRTIELDKLLPMNPKKKKRGPPLMIRGFAEYNNVLFIRTPAGFFTLQLESLEFKELFKSDIYYPFESVYAAGNGPSIGGGHDGAELLHNT
ncbi:hypothetical protein CFC21_086743 [Triticum aestivum]|uniref:F-box protein AT5G49610-like beta-propeller domain-containing protein n=3 Tax=Triticum TaxID=4564 RepID=A0A9R0YEX0_TRITD|nr:hypothetical protein CFC21_086743 [Triticum aestivum]VAI54176.1 unnamed protein product [Triticum turgidum subsp. durum]